MNYTPNQSPLVDPSAIYDSLSCGRRGCRCGRRSGLTHCPAHDDIHPSLSVKVTDGTVLLHCFANCPQDAVLDALAVRGIELRRGRLPAPTEPADVYGYCDENGKLLFQVVRFPGKRCRQRRPCPQGGCGDKGCSRDPDGSCWHWSVSGARLVPYRLPEVIKAVHDGRRVYVVEGERDVESLRALGLAATTAPGGAGKWRPEFCEPLRGARVAILPDNDPPGKAHAEDVARSLQGVAAEVRVGELPELPPKGDVTDWLALGHSGGGLEDLVAQTRLWAPVADTRGIVILKDVEPEDVAWLWPGRIPLGKLTLLEGDPGLGKSLIALDIAARVSSGAPMPDGTKSDLGGPAGVVLLPAEDGLADTVRPRLEAAGADLARVACVVFVPEGGDERPPLVTDIARIREAVEQVNARLVIVDPITAFMTPAQPEDR